MECPVSLHITSIIVGAKRLISSFVRFWMMIVLALSLCGLTSCEKRIKAPVDLSHIPYVDIAPRWSHNGKRICFIRQYETGFMRLYVTDDALNRTTPLTPLFRLDNNRKFRPDYAQWMAREGPAWSANDRFIAYQKGGWNEIDKKKIRCVNIYRVSLSGDLNTPLAIHGKDFKGTLTYYRSIVFSPDGRHFAFMGDGEQDESDVFLREFPITNPDDTIPLYDRYADTDFPSWSPHGNRLAYRQGILRNLTCNRMEELYTIPIGYAKFRRYVIPRKLPQRIVGIVWNPDGNSILLTLANDPLDVQTYSLWTVKLSTGKFKRISYNDGSGYFGCSYLTNDYIGALRYRNGNIEAVGINPQNRVTREIASVTSPDVDWSSSAHALVWSDPNAKGREVKLQVKTIPIPNEAICGNSKYNH